MNNKEFLYDLEWWYQKKESFELREQLKDIIYQSKKFNPF